MRKAIPVFLLMLFGVTALSVKCNRQEKTISNEISTSPAEKSEASRDFDKKIGADEEFLRKEKELFLTKHARCRMDCREITLQEVKEILAEGKINYRKSNLSDRRGPTYALEGITDDGQPVRIIFAPKPKQVSVVTVIDLENEYECNCN